MSAARFAFRLAKAFDKAVEGAGDDPEDTDLVVRDMIERMLHWCDLHKVPFEQELEAGRELYKRRPEEEADL
jgi:hypothetical protein